ncbi:uncharacterized protein LOC113796992 isoform X1 [Dermatophagoides pteronyssinus]|uniref:uncharacterized protein LOC113796992 isoform X1 n=2 Tax=Dermatophagoides pteronyssinus TaxID=6956 RepID=UPI003F669678
MTDLFAYGISGVTLSAVGRSDNKCRMTISISMNINNSPNTIHRRIMKGLIIHRTMIWVLLAIIIVFDVAQAQSSLSLMCKSRLDQCQTEFFNELKQYKLVEHELSYYQLCSSDGSYMRFVDCVREISEHDVECKQQPLHRELCNKRGLKLSSYRYTWKSNLVHDICYRTSASSIIDQDFFKHEKCISEVLNKPKWHCDLDHYEMTKRTNGLEACQHWKSFRQCIYDEVDKHCGQLGANISDYLFHIHTSYFSKYTICNLPGESHTKCWLDLIDSIPSIPITASSTTTTAPPITTGSPIITRIMETTTLESIDRINSRTNLIREAKMKSDHSNDDDQHFVSNEPTTAIAGQQTFDGNNGGQTLDGSLSLLWMMVILLTILLF